MSNVNANNRQPSSDHRAEKVSDRFTCHKEKSLIANTTHIRYKIDLEQGFDEFGVDSLKVSVMADWGESLWRNQYSVNISKVLVNSDCFFKLIDLDNKSVEHEVLVEANGFGSSDGSVSALIIYKKNDFFSMSFVPWRKYKIIVNDKYGLMFKTEDCAVYRFSEGLFISESIDELCDVK